MGTPADHLYTFVLVLVLVLVFIFVFNNVSFTFFVFLASFLVRCHFRVWLRCVCLGNAALLEGTTKTLPVRVRLATLRRKRIIDAQRAHWR